MDAPAGRETVLAIIDGLVGPDRRCPRCGAAGAVKRGKHDGLMRYRCNGCRRTFNALTGTKLSRLRMRDRWIEFAAAARQGETLKETAERCGVHVETAHRWRHAFFGTSKRTAKRRKLGAAVHAPPSGASLAPRCRPTT
jgi:transposase-like protein